MKEEKFREEFDWLSQFLPEALHESFDDNNFEDILEIVVRILSKNQSVQEQTDSIRNISGSQLQPNIIKWENQIFSIERILESLLNIHNSSNATIPNTILSALTTELGREAFGMYLPMHYFFQSRETPWGIYLFPSLIIQWAEDLYNSKGKSLGLTLEEVQLAFTYAVFRHELFHYQVECFSTKQEILTHKVNYKTYKENVNRITRNSEDWLEEALAESTVLYSKHVFHHIKIKAQTFRQLYEFDLQRMPPGYKHYHCRKYGGPQQAKKLFATQISRAKTDPIPSTRTGTVNANEFSNSWKKVPIYMVDFGIPKSIKTPKEIIS